MIRGAFIFALAGVALALAALSRVPDLAGARTPTHAQVRLSAAPAEQTTQPKENAQEAVGYREASLAADARGQYATDALINGMPVKMMIDTGASLVVISASIADRLGLARRAGPKWRIQTANGETSASPTVLNSVSFGGLYMNDVQAVVLPRDAGEVNLLGASFLRRLLSVEQRDGVLILRQ